MQLEYLTRSPVDNAEIIKRQTCRILLKRMYFSAFMQIMYMVLIVSCIVCIMLNLVIKIPGDGSYLIGALEIGLSAFVTGEIFLRGVSQRSLSTCSIADLVDYLILALCLISILLCFHQEFMEILGNTACDCLFIFKSALFVARALFVCNYGEKDRLSSLTVSLNSYDDDCRRRFEQAKIRYKYRPTMAILFEENAEEEEEHEEEQEWFP
ncbi:hypothetical protein SteCoe_36992 [Stentor coeruleus]|uniref:Ion transport domain-containing protein n=1 Tax=Stentor coeruleus TaxID=5963 RepID=A0A1R2APB2_9CILI|nr:hypothetical protein SteCoe_36992 [Stentor coeruleus]